MENEKSSKEQKVVISNYRFTQAKKKRGFASVKEVCDKAEIYYETVKYCLKHGKIMPENLEKLADALNVWPDYLQGVTRYDKEVFKSEDGTTYLFPDNDFDDENIYMGKYEAIKVQKTRDNERAALVDFLNKLDLFLPVPVDDSKMHIFHRKLDFNNMDQADQLYLVDEIRKLVVDKILNPQGFRFKNFLRREGIMINRNDPSDD